MEFREPSLNTDHIKSPDELTEDERQNSLVAAFSAEPPDEQVAVYSAIVEGEFEAVDQEIAKLNDSCTEEERQRIRDRLNYAVQAIRVEKVMLIDGIRKFIKKAGVDAMTGLRIRATLEEELKLIFATTQRFNIDRQQEFGRVFDQIKKEQGEVVASSLELPEESGSLIAFIDHDNFKSINDDIDWLAGDAALVTTAKLLSAGHTRSIDRFYRFGGDEMLELLVDVRPSTLSDIIQYYENLRQEISNTYVQWKEGEDLLQYTASIALVWFSPSQLSPNMPDIIQYLDKSKKKAKAFGKNILVFGSFPSEQWFNDPDEFIDTLSKSLPGSA